MKVLFYGRLADLLGPQVDVAAPGDCTVATVREMLIAQFPFAEQVLRSTRTRAFVGDTLVFDEYRLHGEEVVEFLPPVSGG